MGGKSRQANHEARHAVLGAAIGDRPQHVSIRVQGDTLGRGGARKSARRLALVDAIRSGRARERELAAKELQRRLS